MTMKAYKNFISPDIEDLNLEKYMQEALDEAEKAGQAGELPIGSVIVIDDEIISRGRARHQSKRNQLYHAELNAMLDGGERLWKEYQRAVLFSTVEPCPLCLGAVVMADIPHVIFALHDKVVCSKHTVMNNPYVRRHIKSYYGGICSDQSAAIFAKYDPQALRYIQTGIT
jgi:tRNA(adenine34) deaminase